MRPLDGEHHLAPVVPAPYHAEDLVIGALRADGQAVHAFPAQDLKLPPADAVRIAFHGDLRGLQQPVGAFQLPQDLGDALRSVVAGRSAAEINAVHEVVLHARQSLLQLDQDRVLIRPHQSLVAGK